ncbi:hypothetical protein NBRC116583_23650 [Arenicella sp. 4NH20-0111]|uniref:polynucleotide adenylyltransferase PcnB n=1 Tax=Arenicella sp. 4NH20-0111 TaxID=3127648 RepID=UPI003109E6F5
MITANIIKADEAGIDNENISNKALEVVQSLQEAGYQALLVGGCVRDLLLEKKPKDFDVSTNATPEEIKRTFGKNARIIGRRFKLVHVRFGYEVIEVATFRADASDRKKVGRNEMSEGDQGQLLRDNVFGTIEEDVVRRDFRANALYYDPVKGEILDFMGGLEDIRAKKMISIGEPNQRFTEDPVRMLRVIRFSAKLGFEMEPEALDMIEDQGSLLSHVSSARLFEEVLKLFHGGAAYDTYLLLRKYGLFKYLFPFTEQVAVDGVEGMPERALKNTDRRIHAGKPVIPAFLFACMMWDPVKADAQILMEDGTSEAQAWRVAMNDGLRDQNQYVAVPRRLAEIILDIWNIHFRLIKRNPRMVKTSLNNRRFRAAYDFLLLRTQVHEVDEEVGEWWTKIQEVDAAEREEMINEVGEAYKRERQPSKSNGNEPDGNSIDYNSVNYNANQASTYDEGFGTGYGHGGNVGNSTDGRTQNRTGGRKKKTKRGGKRPSSGQGAKGRSNRSRNAKSGASQREGQAQGQGQQRQKNAQGQRTQNGPNSSKPNRSGPQRRRKKTSSNRGRRATPGSQDSRYVEARPKDDYGNYSSSDSSSTKKVKVRRKRRVVAPDGASKDGNDTPHF